ncbi:hypothetical protein KFE80_12505 [bacterium SCSIO 12696]|nr:hypothetical protein KFE80_12505 [bacterium SCSIO 12696]
MKKYFVFTIFLMFGITPSFADGPGWTVASKVTRIVVVANGGINVRLSPSLNNCVSQSGYGGTYASIYPDHPGLNAMHATLLTAYASGKNVALYLSDDTCRVTEAVLGGTHFSP